MRHLVGRTLVLWAIEAATLWLAALVLPGVALSSWPAAPAAVALLGLLNAVAWPLIVRFALPLTIWTFGVFALALNGALVFAAGAALPGLAVAGLGSGLLVALALTAVNVAVSTVLAIEDDQSFNRLVVLRLARRLSHVERSDVPGVVFLEIDGLSEPALRRAVRDGHLPTIGRWLRAEGGHRLVGWECDLSSQTGASQAGLLLGSNEDLPAFRWYEKETGRVMVSNHPRDAAEIERRLSSGDGLLAAGGASRGNLCSGDAPRSLITLSTALRRGRESRSDLYAFFSDPYAMTRTVVLSLADVWHEVTEAARQRRHDVTPRVSRGGWYPLLRAATTVVLRDLTIATLIRDVMHGVPVVYATFVGYDEVAHHSGVERADALDVLRRLDRQFGRLEHAARTDASRPYHFVVLSDHGQSQGPTFLQRTGLTLEQVVRDGVEPDQHVAVVAPADEGWAAVGGAVTDAATGEDRLGRVVSGATRRRREDGAVVLGDARREARERAAITAAEAADVIVMPSGNLGLVYLPGEGRLTREDIDARSPRLIDRLLEQDGIGFVMVRSAAEGPVVLGPRGTRHVLASGRVDGEDPLRDYGPNAVRHLRRTDGFAHAPDLLVMSVVDAATGEVAAFEELVGSHGGLGGDQSRPFAVVPAAWPVPEAPIVGAEAMHRQLKAWLAHVAARG